MRRIGALIVLVALCVPLVSSAKSGEYNGYSHSRGKHISITAPLGWPVAIESTTNLNATIESLPSMAVLRVLPYKPWWKVFGSLPATTTISVSGLPTNADLHVYTHGYRDHAVVKSNQQGVIKLDLASKRGIQFIIKAKPSTYHINSDPIFATPGRDCNTIGVWTASTKTCTLTGDVYQTISIDSSDVTLDGAGKSVRGDGTGDGIYTDQSNVRITNIEVHNFARGIVYSDSFFTLADGGEVNHVVTADNTRGVVDEGVSNLKITDSDIVVNTTAIELIDQLDGFATDGIVITRNNFKQNGEDLTNDGASFNLSNATERGNWWQRNSSCTQAPAPASPDECTNSFSVAGVLDSAPWACENAWRPGVICPFAGGGGSGTSTIPVAFYTQVDPIWGKNIYDHSNVVETTCAGTTTLNMTIKQCGCYMTSIANMLKLTDFGTDTNGKVFDPGYLNQWLKNNSGYTDSGDFSAASVKALTTSLNKGKYLVLSESMSVDKDRSLEQVFTKLQSILSTGEFAVVRVPGGHFVLATGNVGTTSKIMDPTWYLTQTLNDSTVGAHIKNYNNVIRGFRSYKEKDSTVVSNFLQIFIGSPVDIIVTDPMDRVLNYHPDTAGSYSSIPDSSYWTDLVIDPEYSGPVNRDEAKFIFIHNPLDGIYTITLNGTANGTYKITVSDIRNSVLLKDSSAVSLGQTISYKLNVFSGLIQDMTRQNVTNKDHDNKPVCHKPPGNPANSHTLYLPVSAIRAHLGHGDKMGECEKEIKSGKKEEKKKK